MRSLLMLMLVVVAVTSLHVDAPAEKQDIIDAVNSAQTTWKAGRNFHESFTKSRARKRLGHKKRAGKSDLPVQKHDSTEAIPESFDTRTHWPKCASVISHIRDQSDCGSCWAVSAASVFSDRMCIATSGTFTTPLSARDVLSCCLTCGDGCDGGYDDHAWKYFKQHGLVTGGDYDSDEGCQPYPLQPCEHHVNGTRIPCDSLDDPATPKCLRKCSNDDYKTSYSKDHHKTKKSYVVESTVEAIQREMLKHGPVQAGFTVYEDFYSYTSGVYQHVTGEMEGGHAVKIIGWGVLNGTPYWEVANSWNTDWGDEGFFKIRRGNDECGFESEISAGIPKVK